MQSSPRNASGDGSSGGQTARPPLMKRQSSASSHSSRQALASPGSASDQYPLRHAVKARHTKIVLPRNHSSGRNLAKLARQAQNANTHTTEDGRKHTRQRSHEGDTEIRLPGSLDEGNKPAMRRNMTAYQLPRNTSNAKLKKNLSHGQLTRLGSGRNMMALNTANQRAPPSPGLKGKSKRPKSADLTGLEKQLQEQGLELPRQKQQGRKGSGKRVGFAVGSVDDASDEEQIPDMEGSGLQEDEWTEESASASPYSTRQNTANNSRRPSVVVDKLSEKLPPLAGRPRDHKASSLRWEGETAEVEEAVGDSEESGSSEAPSPRSKSHDRRTHDEHTQQPEPRSSTEMHQPHEESRTETHEEVSHVPALAPEDNAASHVATSAIPQQHVSSQIKEHQNPTTRRLLDRGQHLPAPALLSNISALDDMHSNRESPEASMTSSQTNIDNGSGDGQEDELVSRFVPSASHPSTGSGGNTAVNTPRQSGFHTPEEDSTLVAQRRETRAAGFQPGPASPGSPVSASSGATTPAMQRSRMELRMLQEKAMADLETAADQRPPLPAHVYDRRNESLKSYLNIAGLTDSRGGTSMGPDLFQGRFRALNTELRVVQKFRDPLAEAVSRLKECRGSQLHGRALARKPTSTNLTSSKSAISLPAQRVQETSDLSKSASPPKSSHSLKKGIDGGVQMQGGSERQKGRREVSFARAPPGKREVERVDGEVTPETIARQLWEAV